MSTFERLGREIRTEIGAISLSGATAGLAFRAALAGVLAVVVALAAHLDNPYWAGITAFGLLQQDVAATLSRALDRVLGSIAGAVLGYVAAATVAHHAVFTGLCAVIVSFTLYGQARMDHSYAVLLVGVTALLVMFGSLSTPDAALDLAVYRGLEIIVGVAVASFVDIMLAPQRGDAAKGAPKPGIFSRPVDVDQLVIAISAGLAIASVPSVWTSLELPGLGQTPITAFVIMIAMRRDPQWTAATRAIGCLAGGAYGLLCLGLVGDSLFLWLGLLFLGLYLSGHVLHRQGDASYAGQQAGVAAIIAMVAGEAPSADILPAIDRLVGIFGGIVLVSLFQILLSPAVRWCVLRIVQPKA
ncbi:hypothetical protein GCM10007874_24770 [Labrys miyagiensis]|uniref:FUSC family protein n=1 Tax=Labrys miyagiensis TaxID=346912 RepID=A0ABQ6CH33_9HYPH|nr:FUSC family protein [Labrys miyagiensis]GLS19460.1 hypothetical protein GCM10007874_24770 [Labrys miyagiensis]